MQNLQELDTVREDQNLVVVLIPKFQEFLQDLSYLFVRVPHY